MAGLFLPVHGALLLGVCLAFFHVKKRKLKTTEMAFLCMYVVLGGAVSYLFVKGGLTVPGVELFGERPPVLHICFGVASLFLYFFLLAISSIEDAESSSFYVLPLIVVLVLEGILLILSLCFHLVTIPFSLWVKVLCLVTVVRLLGLFAYSVGDAWLMIGCVIVTLIIRPELVFLQLLVTFMVAGAAYIGWNIRNIKVIMADKNARFPFTTPIAIGTMVGFFLVVV